MIRIEKTSIEFTRSEFEKMMNIFDHYLKTNGLKSRMEVFYFSQKMLSAFQPKTAPNHENKNIKPQAPLRTDQAHENQK